MKTNKTQYADSVSVKHKKTLCLDFGDTYVTVTKMGSFDNKDQYAWSTMSPTEGLTCDYDSQLIQYDTLITRLDILYECPDSGKKLKPEEYHAIKLFLEN